MKKKKINKNENEWKGILQEKEPFTIIENYDIPDRIKKELSENKCSTHFYQVGKSNVSTESVTSTNVKSYEEKYLDLQEHLKTNPDKPFIWGTPGSDYDVDLNELTKKWKDYSKDKTLSDEEEHCNVGVNKDWGTIKEELNKFYHENWVKENVSYKQKRIDFEFTPFTFWQLFPSVALNLHCKEIECVWLCFGMYIKYKI